MVPVYVHNFHTEAHNTWLNRREHVVKRETQQVKLARILQWWHFWVLWISQAMTKIKVASFEDPKRLSEFPSQ